MADEHNAVVRRSFERQVQLFSGHDSPFARRSPGPLTWIEPLDREMVVLDVACGAGHAAEQVAPQVRAVVGIDMTPVLLEVGAQRLRANGIANVLLQEGDAESLPFMGESFHVAFCRSSLHHFARPEKAIAEMMRVCRPDGRIVILDIVPPDRTVRERFDLLHRLLDPSHVHSFLEGELADMLGGGGALTYADSISLRLPIDVAITEQSDTEQIFRLLDDELSGGRSSGFEPVRVDDKMTVVFTTCILHAERPGYVSWRD